jgi:hypothetical protein
MLWNAYTVLLGIAFYLNRHDWRMLALTFVIGVSVFAPVPRESALAFYGFCFAAELAVAIVALLLRARGSELVVSICVVLEVAHVMGYILNGYPPLSSYRVIVPILESAQLVTCICMSPVLHLRLRNRHHDA